MSLDQKKKKNCLGVWCILFVSVYKWMWQTHRHVVSPAARISSGHGWDKSKQEELAPQTLKYPMWAGQMSLWSPISSSGRETTAFQTMTSDSQPEMFHRFGFKHLHCCCSPWTQRVKGFVLFCFFEKYAFFIKGPEWPNGLTGGFVLLHE